MRVDRRLLPTRESDWHAFLRDYFCDKDAIATPAPGLVDLRLVWPDGPERHVDPALELGLRWWGRGVTVGTMWSAWWREGRILTALFDTWTLFSWSQWLASVPQAQDIVVLHVDDHRDLGSPRLIVDDTGHTGTFTDAITGATVRLVDPGSIRQAIESGAIGMGSFLTPFVWAFPQAPVRHLCQPPKMRTSISAKLVPSLIEDTLLRPGAKRPGVELAPLDPGANESYVGTSDVQRWAEGIEGRRALVHIDMDYFNNRYDGDSDWSARSPRLDPDLPAMLGKVDELVEALAASKARVQDVTLAYSPGFFPAEHWELVDQRLRAGLVRIL